MVNCFLVEGSVWWAAHLAKRPTRSDLKAIDQHNDLLLGKASGAPGLLLDAENTAVALVRRWRELSELERRVFDALVRELSVSSDLVEKSTLDLSERFQALACIAEGQVARVDKIIAAASAIVIEGAVVPLDQALATVESTLRAAVETIVFVSKHAMRMVYTLDDVARDVADVALCSGQIEVINRQARYLALNAAIEATRSGAAGAAFEVIAHEMKQLSQATDQTSVQVRDRISRVTSGVARGHDVMRGIATMDMSGNIMAKEHIDHLLAGIKAQHDSFGAVLEDSARSSKEMASTVNQLISGIQFQDRTKQHTAQIIDTISALSDGTIAAQAATDAAFPGLFQAGDMNHAALGKIIEKQTLGAMKARLLTRLLDGDAVPASSTEPGSDCGGDIDLF